MKNIYTENSREEQELVNTESKTPISKLIENKIIVYLSSVILRCKSASLGSTICGLHREWDGTNCLQKSLRQPFLSTH